MDEKKARDTKVYGRDNWERKADRDWFYGVRSGCEHSGGGEGSVWQAVQKMTARGNRSITSSAKRRKKAASSRTDDSPGGRLGSRWGKKRNQNGTDKETVVSI